MVIFIYTKYDFQDERFRTDQNQSLSKRDVCFKYLIEL
jgi:hypothetical protein